MELIPAITTLILGGALLVLLVFLLVAPWEIAKRKHSPKSRDILLLSLLGALTGIFWIIALVWALMEPDRSAEQITAKPGSWKLTGIDRSTARETSIVVEASSENLARAMGDVKGIVVARVEKLDAAALSKIEDERIAEHYRAKRLASEPLSPPTSPRGEFGPTPELEPETIEEPRMQWKIVGLNDKGRRVSFVTTRPCRRLSAERIAAEKGLSAVQVIPAVEA